MTLADLFVNPLGQLGLVLLLLLVTLLVLLIQRLPSARQRQFEAEEREARDKDEAAQSRQTLKYELRQDWRSDLQASTQALEQGLRSEIQAGARDGRQELAQLLSLFQQQLTQQAGELGRSQNEQIDALRVQLSGFQSQVGGALQAQAQHQGEAINRLTETLVRQAQAGREAQEAGIQRQVQGQAEALTRFGAQQSEAFNTFGQQLAHQLRSQAEAGAQSLAELRAAIEQRFGALQAGVEQRLATLQQTTEQRLLAMQQGSDQRLAALQADTEKKLEQMRLTVDEKLHATLEQRLGESFRQVAERLEQVQRGLGEMQSLAQGVGDLKRVLSNVKTRGVFGEVQLAGLLEQVFTPEQYGVNVATRPGSAERVEFAIRLPGRSGERGLGQVGLSAGGAAVWLPIDAKFPREDYERLLDAQDRADREAADQASRALEQRIRDEARSIRAKYVEPPHTTDFAILFLPTEGLYAELLRRPGLNEALMREHQVTLAGPTTLLAMLNSLQMGFRTLAIEQRSSEVWQVLGAVKTEFGKFGDVLAKTKKKLQEAQNTIESAEVRSRAMDRKLRIVEALDGSTSRQLLGLEGADEEEAAATAAAAVATDADEGGGDEADGRRGGGLGG